MASWGIGLTGGGGGHVGIFWVGMCHPGLPVLKKGRNLILLFSIQSGVCLIEVFNNRK